MLLHQGGAAAALPEVTGAKSEMFRICRIGEVRPCSKLNPKP